MRRLLQLTLAAVLVTAVAIGGGELFHDPRSGGGSTVGPAEIAPTTPPGTFPVGVSFGDTLRSASDSELSAALDDMVRLHATWIRIDLSWSEIQPDSAGSFDWSAIDRIVKAARQRRLQVLGLLTYTPAWARAPGCTTFTCPPASPTTFATYAAAAAARYDHGRIAAFEVWNEPNSPRFWSSPNASSYRNLLLATLASVRAAAPTASVVLGGLAAYSSSSGLIDPPRFLRGVCSGGGCSRLAGIGYHPYTYPLTAQETTPQRTAWERMTVPSSWGPSLLAVMRSVGIAREKLWLTEYGAPGDRGSAGATQSGCACVSEPQQARIVASGITGARNARAFVGAVFIYTWKDQGTGRDPEDHFGLRRYDGSEKPSYDAFRQSAPSTG